MNTVGIAELKAHLSEHLRAVRRGQAITVVDRQTPIAKLVPIDEPAERLTVRRPLRPLHTAELPRQPISQNIDSLAALLEERQNQR